MTSTNEIIAENLETIDQAEGEDIVNTEENNNEDSSAQEENGYAVENGENTKVPVNSDDEYDTDLEAEVPHEDYDPTGKNVYLSCCKSLDVTPVSYFIRHIRDPKVKLRHRGLGPKGTKAMAIALVLNTSITSLDLHDNALEPDGGTYIADMLKENCFVQELDISSNNIGNKGCQAICEMLQVNTNLQKLDLSDNKLTDKESQYIADAMRGNEKLLWLDLSNNRFSENSGENLGLGIVSNDSLEYLNLSWNHIRKKGAIQISHGIRRKTRLAPLCRSFLSNSLLHGYLRHVERCERRFLSLHAQRSSRFDAKARLPFKMAQSNCTLKTINLSYNGFTDDGALALGEAIKFNNTLIELDISNNRITNLGAMCLSKGIESNNTLEVLKIGYNPIQSDGLASIVNASLSYCDSALATLYCQDIYLDKNFHDLLHEVNKMKPEFKVVPSPRAGGKDPMKALQRYIEEDRDRWLELFTDCSDDVSNMVTRKNFINVLKPMFVEEKLKIELVLIEILSNLLITK
ncbi:Leucine-rich repeat-containing protein 74A [Exaiptasia diaphana]|nr:Leucine-rich repeat-containing protein 74A [Exaiptasia diaphana]